MTFSPEVVKRIVRQARANEIEPAALLAVAEVESMGRPLEPDGVTPRFLFERHVFYRALKREAPDRLEIAVSRGLAIPKWDRKTQYKDQGTAAGRMKTLMAARAIDTESAYQACSWGLGQVLGENAVKLGYESATDFVTQLIEGGVPAQVESMLRFVKKNGLMDELKLHNWADFALKYNGAGYKQNQYDLKMAAAYKKWARELDATIIEPEVNPEDPVEPEPEIEDIPPPYVEPKTPAKSKTVWSVIMDMMTKAGIGVAAAFGFLKDNPEVIIALVVAGIFLSLYIGRERIRKIVEEHC